MSDPTRQAIILTDCPIHGKMTIPGPCPFCLMGRATHMQIHELLEYVKKMRAGIEPGGPHEPFGPVYFRGPQFLKDLEEELAASIQVTELLAWAQRQKVGIAFGSASTRAALAFSGSHFIATGRNLIEALATLREKLNKALGQHDPSD